MPRDILEIATEQLGDPEPSITFDALFDAALRSLRPLPHQHPRRVEVLNVAMDRLYRALTNGETDAIRPIPSSAPAAYGVARRPQPKLKP